MLLGVDRPFGVDLPVGVDLPLGVDERELDWKFPLPGCLEQVLYSPVYKEMHGRKPWA